MKKAFFFSLLVALLAMQCDKADDTIKPVPDPTDGTMELAEMNQALGWELFQNEQQAQPGENVLVSPFSVQTALLMAQNGAQGSTQAQILDAMGGTTFSAEALNEAYGDLEDILEQSGHPQVTVANGFFYDDSRIDMENAFLSTLNESYDASAQILDFREATASVDAINNWVEQQTNGKIKDLLEQITDDDLAFLINALHFKADWATGFSEDATYPAAFTNAAGNEVEVEYVNADRDFTTATHDGLQMVDLPFRDSTFSLSLIRPETTEAGWPGTFTTARWLSLYDQTTYGRAMVFFPKLELSYKNDLLASLKQMGMTDAFIPGMADFSAMGQPLTGPTIYISQIAHNAVLEIDEKGAEGAAATSIGFSTTSAPPMFRFDQPFVLVLRHIPTNTMLFVGYVADPMES